MDLNRLSVTQNLNEVPVRIGVSLEIETALFRLGLAELLLHRFNVFADIPST